MAGVLLDTNVVSEVARPQASPAVTHWLRQQPPETLYLSAITIGELTRGVHRLPQSRRREHYESWITGALARQFQGRILDFDQEAAVIWGQLLADGDRSGRTRSPLDAQIAATALRHGLAVATRNVRDFEGLELDLLNPWTN